MTDTCDNKGNAVSQAGAQNQYDFENHLVQHGDVKLVYDGDGNRVGETIGATERVSGCARNALRIRCSRRMG